MSETCRVIINQVKQKLHLVGYLPIQYRTLLYSLSIINGKIYNANLLLKQQCYVEIIITCEGLKFVAIKHLESEIAASLIEGHIYGHLE